MKTSTLVLSLFFLLLMASCGTEKPTDGSKVVTAKKDTLQIYWGDFEVPKPNEKDWNRFDKHFVKNTDYVNDLGLARLSDSFYMSWQPASTMPLSSKMIYSKELEVHFFPLNQDTAQSYQYAHEYECNYNHRETRRYGEVAYPSPCLGKDKLAKAKVVITNKSNQAKKLRGRLFYQNNSYWYTTSVNADFQNKFFLGNYYGGSELQKLEIPANSTKEFFVAYRIGMNPTGNMPQFAPKKEEKDSTFSKIPKEELGFYGPARPGAYEFMFWVTEDSTDILLQDTIDYKSINPFAHYSQQIKKGNVAVLDRIAYTHPKHFKFVTLMETFADSKKSYQHQDVYWFGDRDEKPLCDTCTGYFRDTITDVWNTEDFFTGFISKTNWVKAEYGNRKENVRIDNNGIYLRSPKSTPTNKQKTWGEVKFAPAFLYGTVKVVAKFSQLRNKSNTPTGIVHNLWLYQQRPEVAPPIPGHPYETMTNNKGQQPYEIDIEIWSKIYDENWQGGSNINYSIVDYMRYADALVKPGEFKKIDGHDVDRHNNVQLNYPGKDLLHHDFFEDYHLYEIIWTPFDIKYKIDGNLMAKIDWRMAKIPDEYSFLWVGSPIYQDGTYYTQNSIPFLPYDAFTHIRYISIE